MKYLDEAIKSSQNVTANCYRINHVMTQDEYGIGIKDYLDNAIVSCNRALKFLKDYEKYYKKILKMRAKP